MASSIQLLRSTIAQERPFPANLLEGQPAVNLNSSEPGLFFKAADGSLVKFGPAAITSDGLPPNSSHQGSSGNTVGELWLDKSTNPPVLKVYDGVEWIDAGSGGGGGGGGTASFMRWIYTAAGGETSLSGSSGGVVLEYTPGLEEVYINGVLITRGTDYSAINGTSVTNLSPLTAGDVITVISMNPVSTVQLPGQVTLLRWTTLAQAGQTILSGIDSSGQQLVYTPDFEEVYVNGVFLRRGLDYTATSGTSITLSSPLALDDEISILAWSTFSIGEQITNADVSGTANISATKLGFTRTEANATARTVQDKLDDYISVKDFIPSGIDTSTTDCTQYIRNAMAVSNRLDFGDQSDVYLITSPLDIANESFGAEANWRANAAMIQGDCDLLVNVQYSSFKGFRFRNLTSDHKLITAVGSTRMGYFEDCLFFKAAYHFYHNPPAVGAALVHTQFVRCWFREASVYSRYFNSALMSYSERDCYTWYNKRGLYFNEGTGILISGGVFEYNDEQAIVIEVDSGRAINDANITAVHFEENGWVTPSPHIDITVPTGSGCYMTIQDCRGAATAYIGEKIRLTLSGSAGGQVYLLNNTGLTTTPISSQTFKVNDALGYIYGDGQRGRAIRCFDLILRPGTTLNTLSAEIESVWNGYPQSQIDDISKGSSGVEFGLSSSGELLTIKQAVFGSSTPIAVLSATLVENDSGTSTLNSIYNEITTVPSGADLSLGISSDANGGLVDLTTIKRSPDGYFKVRVTMVTRDWYE